MDEKKSILHELYVYSEWKPEPEYIQKPDGLLPDNISALWRWIKFLGPKKSLLDSITAHKERQQKWHIALGEEGKLIAVLTDNILEIRTRRSDYATIAARTTVNRDAYAQWRKLVWSPDCTFVAVAYGNGVVSFFDLTASNLFNIPIDCSRPGGLECTDNTHAVADIIFLPFKDTKWSWEVLIVNYDGKVRGFLVSQMDGFTLHHTITFGGGIAAVAYCDLHATLYVAGMPKGSGKDPDSAQTAGITAWRVLNDEPYYKLSVVSDQLEGQGNEKFQFYMPFVSNKNLAFVVQMALSPDNSKLVCIHCNGDVTIWRLPILKLLYRYPLACQPEHDLRNPLVEEKPGKKDLALFHPADVNWWSNEEVIMSRFSGAVSVCAVEELRPLLARRVFLEGAARVSPARGAAFLALECESTVLPAKRTSADDSMEVVPVEEEIEDTMFDTFKELLKYVVFAITDIETFQPRPKRVTCVSRVYRLLAVKSTTPSELFARKIESGKYSEALQLAETFSLDSDQVYQQQWRKNPVSTEAIQKYLSKVSKKIWAIHQCVDRLPETLPAAKELLQFGLELTNENILEEINKDRSEGEEIADPYDIAPEHLNTYTRELLRCRHVMLFYRERLHLYESILKYEKSTYVKDEYDRLRSNSIMRSSIEIAKEGRIEALTCLWPHISTLPRKLAVLDNLPETINPLDYQHLLPTKLPMQWFQTKSPIKIPPIQYELDWCRKDIFRSIWSSNWSEETTPDSETNVIETVDITIWYERRAREIERRSGLVSHALTLVTLATVGGGVQKLDEIVFQLTTLDTLVYDRNVEGITLEELEKMTRLEICNLLMKPSTEDTFVRDLNEYAMLYLKRLETLSQDPDCTRAGLQEYLESISVNDLAPLLLFLRSEETELDVRTHLELVEKCILAHTNTDQLDIACDLLDTILRETDGTISEAELVSRVSELQTLVGGCSRLSWRGVAISPKDLDVIKKEKKSVRTLLTRLARELPLGETKPTPSDWEKLLKDILELKTTVFDYIISLEQCYEIYASALLTSGDANTIRMAANVLQVSPSREPRDPDRTVSYMQAVDLILDAATEYFNSASALNDPALELARCCLMLIKEENYDIKYELDLISALQICHSFNLLVIPVQVRLCEDRMKLIDDCLKSDPNAFLASHKLLKLATLLRIEPDNDKARECLVLELVCARALEAGAHGGGASAACARRLAALRRAPLLVARVARDRHAHADTAARRALLAAAAATAPPTAIEGILTDRLKLEIESLQQSGIHMKETSHLISERCPSTDDEYADAITTPVIEKKDLVTTEQSQNKLPLFNYLLETFKDTFSSGDAQPSTTEECTRTVHVPEFYQSLYPEHEVNNETFRYDRFSLPDSMQRPSVSHNLLKWFYIQNCLEEDGFSPEMEEEVVRKCSEALVYSDTALSVMCGVRGARAKRLKEGEKRVTSHNTPAALAANAYAALLRLHAPDLKDTVYLMEPVQLAEQPHPDDDKYIVALSIIDSCTDGLTIVAEVEALRAAGLTVNSLMYQADSDYRREIVYLVARCSEKEHLQFACHLATKYGLDPLEVWLQHAAASPSRLQLPPPPDPLPADAHARILDGLYSCVAGNDYPALIQLFTILKNVDEKPFIHGLTAAEHIKLLKKAKAASPDLNYKFLLEPPPREELTDHFLQVMKPETVGMVAKFLRTLPPAMKLPLSVNALYTKWLTKYFFSVPPSSASSKKWMQQYRQCASFFNKLSKEEMLNFVRQTCFSDEAIEKVPAGTRNLMILQAVEYCQHEQENDYKFKNELTWAQIGQELTRWNRFLENLHSEAVQNIIENSNVPRNEIWPEIEKSHGDPKVILPYTAELVLRRDIKPKLMTSLLQCLHVDIHLADVFIYIYDHCLKTVDDTKCLVARVTSYQTAGVALPPSVVSRCAAAAAEYLVPHRGLVPSPPQQTPPALPTEDIFKLIRDHWPDSNYVNHLTEEQFKSEEGQRTTYQYLVEHLETIPQKKTLVDVITYWPPSREMEPRSIHCEFLKTLLSSECDLDENLICIKILLRPQLLTEEEVDWLLEHVTGEVVTNMIWIVLLNKSIKAKDIIVKLLKDHKEVIKKQEVDDTLIKELLENQLLIPLVPTILYPCIVNYIIGHSESVDSVAAEFNVRWAVRMLMRAKFYAEAGHLYLMAGGAPIALRGFSESVTFCYDNLHFTE